VKIIRATHRWLGLLIAIQAVVWSLSGLVMVLLPADLVSGETLLNHDSNEIPQQDMQKTAAIIDSIVKDVAIKGFTAQMIGDTAVLFVTTITDEQLLYALDTGQSIIIDEQFVRSRANDLLGPSISILFADKVETASREFQGPLPAWKVIAGNDLRSHLYFSGETGELLAHRTSYWRWHRYSYDLHTFNFTGAATINNPLLAIFAVLMFCIAFSGIGLLLISFFGSQRKAKQK